LAVWSGRAWKARANPGRNAPVGRMYWVQASPWLP
jgi:hypothetical protein